ncbi:condensation domain-containing protein, partial [Frankia sp. R82]|uniref:condensation domain-containing protein n=1 Tax=Frankia sp. R82 TaxID=2950553 RepID=UPI002043F496
VADRAAPRRLPPRAGAGAFGAWAQAAGAVAFAAVLAALAATSSTAPTTATATATATGAGPRSRSGLGVRAGAPSESGTATETTGRPLSLPEQVLLASDRAHTPIVIALFGRTDGQLDARRLAAATIEVFARHPATRSELADLSGRGGWRIRPRPRRAPVHESAAATSDDAWQALNRVMRAGLDLRRAPLARLLVVHQPGGDWLGIVGHHLALDGRSLLAVLTETMAAYRTDPPFPSDQHTIGEDLVGEDLVGEDLPAPTAGGPGQPGRTRQRPWPTHRSRFIQPVGTSADHGFGLLPQVIPVPRPRRLPDGQLPTVNDVLVAAAHLAIGRWNAGHGRASDVLRVRVALAHGTPTALGGLSSRFVIVPSDADTRAAPARLLAAVVERTSTAKSRVAVTSAALVGGSTRPVVVSLATRLSDVLANALPDRPRAALLNLAVAASRPVLMPSAAVSNLGRVGTDLTVGTGGPRLLDLHLTAPARMPQGLAIHVVGMADRIHLTFSHARELWDDAAVRTFANLFDAAVRELTSTPGATAPPTAVPSPHTGRRGVYTLADNGTAGR